MLASHFPGGGTVGGTVLAGLGGGRHATGERWVVTLSEGQGCVLAQTTAIGRGYSRRRSCFPVRVT